MDPQYNKLKYLSKLLSIMVILHTYGRGGMDKIKYYAGFGDSYNVYNVTYLHCIEFKLQIKGVPT